MTREKAIEVLKYECYLLPFLDGDRATLINTALDVAVEALKQKTNEDCIKRSDACLTDFEIVMCDGDYKEALKLLTNKIEKASSVTPQLKMRPVLDKIRAEIENAAFDWQEIDGEHNSFRVVELTDALDIIDNYRKESEE